MSGLRETHVSDEEKLSKESITAPSTHVSEAKKAKVKELAELMKKKTVMVISIKGLTKKLPRGNDNVKEVLIKFTMTKPLKVVEAK